MKEVIEAMQQFFLKTVQGIFLEMVFWELIWRMINCISFYRMAATMRFEVITL